MQTAKMTEAKFIRMVLTLAKLARWRTAHFRPAQTAKGWRTAVQGDGVGFPDLILVRGSTLIVAELKIPPRLPTPEQLAWLDAWRKVTRHTYLWTPADWNMIESVLGNA